MYRPKIRFLFALLCVILLCSAVQATNLMITVEDSLNNSTISNANVFLDGQNIGMTNGVGQYLLTSGQGPLDIRVSMNGYYDWENTSVDPTQTALLVLLNRQTLVLKVNLLDSNTLAPVSGAMLFLTSNNVSTTQQTDATGSASFWVNPYTSYGLNITAQNYQPRSETVITGSTDQQVQYLLLSGNQYSFVVEDKDTLQPVPGAEVQINGVLVGKTDARGILITPITRGSPLMVAINATGYLTTSESETISTNVAVETVYLAKTPMTAFIFVNDQNNQPIADAGISINGTTVGSTNQFGQATLTNLVVGSYVVSAAKSGYETTTQQIDLTNPSNDFTIVLPFGQADLTIYVLGSDQKSVANATVILDNTTLGVTDLNGQFVAPITYNTTYNITSAKDGYQSVSLKEQFPLGNATPSVTLTLEKNLDWGFISMVAIGIIVILFILSLIRIARHRRRRHVIRRNEI